MKKFGFTLAEVLITLGIIGVVAALTAPALVLNARNESNAARLSVVVSNLENAFTSALVQENVANLTQTRMFRNIGNNANAAQRAAFAGELGRYIHLQGARDSERMDDFYSNANVSVYKINDNANPMHLDGNWLYDPNHPEFPLFFKNGAVVFLHQENVDHSALENQIRAVGGSLTHVVAEIIVDVNGLSTPNTLGRDLFLFYLGADGILYPAGGLDAAAFDHAAQGID